MFAEFRRYSLAYSFLAVLVFATIIGAFYFGSEKAFCEERETWAVCARNWTQAFGSLFALFIAAAAATFAFQQAAATSKQAAAARFPVIERNLRRARIVARALRVAGACGANLTQLLERLEHLTAIVKSKPFGNRDFYIDNLKMIHTDINEIRRPLAELFDKLQLEIGDAEQKYSEAFIHLSIVIGFFNLIRGKAHIILNLEKWKSLDIHILIGDTLIGDMDDDIERIKFVIAQMTAYDAAGFDLLEMVEGEVSRLESELDNLVC